MRHKTLHESRIRSYYIDAAKDIIKHQDIKNASIRHIAEKAGYSLATTYNYFKNNKELLYSCIPEFLKEFEDELNNAEKQKLNSIDKIKYTFIQYIQYLIKFPGIFDLLYLEDFSTIQNKEFIELLSYYPNNLCEDEWMKYSQDYRIDARYIDKLKIELNTFTIGCIMLHSKRNSNPIVTIDVIENIDFIFRQ